ncbi:rho guanine nucleotide exchange factor 10-like protein [Liolophura sinensis]|uniref:rho guanine nucleotide exchange factor 10-like protein n=1 Tax=Liolophura sinensis TaxID=3198878 RepID=UPI003158D3CA
MVSRVMSSENRKSTGGQHISDTSYHGNQGSSGSKVKVKDRIITFEKIKDAVTHADDSNDHQNVYSDALSSVEITDDEGVYSDAWSAMPISKGDHLTERYNTYKQNGNIMANEMPETSEITLANTQLDPMQTPGASGGENVSGSPVHVAAESSPVQSVASLADSTIYDEVPSKDSSLDCFTESLPDKHGRNLSDRESAFISYTQSLPPNFSLADRPERASLTGENDWGSAENIRAAKNKSLTLRRRSAEDKNRGSGEGQEFYAGDQMGEFDEDENIYESMYLQPLPGDNEYDSDDISWSSDEFESYEDSIHNEAVPKVAPEVAQPATVIMGPPASRVRKIHIAHGLEEPQYPSLLRRLKESFKGSADLSSGEEDSPCLPVEICDIKHPPPVLPPLPSGLTTNQVKRRHAIGVLIDSEKSYIASLQRLLDDFKEPLLEIPSLQRGKVRVELVKAKDILQYHRMFQIELAEQVKMWHAQEKIGDVFTASFSKAIVLDAYSEYVNNFTAAMEEIKKMTRQRASLRDYLKAKEMSSPDRLGLFGLMVKPVQRFPQFITCLQDLLKYTPHDHHDRLGLQRALTELENIAHKLNERKRESEQKLEAKAMLANFKEHMITKTGHEQNRKMIRVDDLDQVVEASNKFKKRRLILLDDLLILTTVIPSRDGVEPERYKLKWCCPLSEVELKESSLSSSMQSSVRGEPGKITVVFAKPENPDEDPFHLVTDLSELHHDFSVLSNVVALVSALKRSYTGLSEESVHALIRDLQRIIHVKDEQLRLVKSCSITLSVPCRTVTGGMGRTKYVFHTQSPSAREDWCLDLQIAKMGLEARNNPGWDIPHAVNGISSVMPALFIKALPVDVVRHYTKVRCAVPVFLSTPSNIGVGMQHLWVCNTTATRGQVSIVSIHSNRPRVIESYQACDCEIVCVENVPGYSAENDPYSFKMDTVWMVTVKAEVLIYQLTSSDGLTKRQPSATFALPSPCSYLKYVDECVFAALDNGQMAVYTRDIAGKWNVTSPLYLNLGTKPVKCLFPLENHLLCTSGNVIHFVSLTTLEVQKSHKLSPDDDVVIGHVTRAGVGLWVSYEDQPLIHVYHLETLNQLQDVNVSSAVQKALTGQVPEDILSSITKDIQVSCLLASKGLLWIGTCKGVILTLPLPRLREGVPQIVSRPCVSFHGHCGPVRFLLPIYFLTPEVSTLKAKTALREYDYVPFKPSVEKQETQSAKESAEANPVQNDRDFDEATKASIRDELASKTVWDEDNPKTELSNSNHSITSSQPNSETAGAPALESLQTLPTDRSDLGQAWPAKTLASELAASHFPPKASPSMARRKDFWQSTPNLAADFDGTEDISVLYGSLMQGLDNIHEPYGLRRKKQAGVFDMTKRHTLHTSASKFDSQTSGKSKLSKYKRSRKRSNSLLKDEDLGVVEEGIAQITPSPTQSEAPVTDTPTLSPKSCHEAFPGGTTLSLPRDQTGKSNAQNPASPSNTDDDPTSSQGRRQSWGTTLPRKPVNACKSVIVVSGGDGYCSWNKLDSSKIQRTEEATLLLWLHKVSS